MRILELQKNREEQVNASGKFLSATIPYVVSEITEVNVEEAGIVYALQNSPSSFQSMPKKSVRILERCGNNALKVAVEYAAINASGGGLPEDTYSFSISGKTQKKTHSIKTRGRYPSTATDYKGAMNVSDDDEVLGVDVFAPNLVIQVSKYFPQSAIDETFIKNLAKNSQKINSASWRGFSAGELLFTGADIPKRAIDSSDYWEISYSLQYAENKSSFSVGDISGIAAYGWDTVWVKYRKKSQDLGGGKKDIAPDVVAVYVEQVFEEIDFSEIGL